ncbi:MAG: PatA/PatG family cyanobactin maturation protease [Chitinophagaceae bacterium]|nr:PatA/PatG family cyanobactin maturation protease [Chitinophagaceae bacterium]
MSTISGLPALQAITLGDPSIKIAVLDGPVDLEHECFTGTAVTPASVHPSASAGLALRHGTAVYSLLFGKPGSIAEGVSPGCSGLIIPIYTETPNGGFAPASQVRLARAIQMALEQGANIINISGGQFSKYGDAEFLLKKAIDDCYKAGVLIVAAAGNEGCYCLHVPASDRQVLAVGSMDENGNPTAETNFGAHYQANGIIAPGVNRTAAMAGGTTFQTNGATSYATPIVSGIVALLMSLQIKNGIKPDAYIIKSILENTAIPCPGDGAIDCKRFLRGKLNLPAAMAAIQESPGILASGLEFSTVNIVMDAAQHTTAFTEVVAVDNIDEPTEQLSATGNAMPAEEMVFASCGCESTDTGTAISTDLPLTLSRDGPAIQPSEKETAFSAIIESNQFVKKLNMQKMENNSKNQLADAAGTIESTNPGLAMVLPGAVEPSDCGCGCGGNKAAAAAEGGGDGGNGGGAAEPATLVYALGNLDYDFGSEAHRDSFAQSMGGNPNDPAAIIKYLKANPWAAEELTWTLNIDATPIYAICPFGPYSTGAFERIRQYFEQQQNGNIQRISVPGVSHGSTTLLNGYGVANLMPNLRGMYSWTTEALTAAATSTKGSAKALAENVGNFLNRIYYQMRNLGTTPQERALNYAATNAFQVSAVFSAALKENLELHEIAAEKSPICRPGSDCYDVTLSFFNPKERLTVARKEYRFTIDVSDVVPVTVGEVRAWSVY